MSSESTISISSSQLAQLQGQLAELQSANAAARAETEAAKSREMIRSGQGDAVLRQHQTELAEAKARAANYAGASALSSALASQPLGVGAAEQLTVLFAGEIISEPDGNGSYAVRSRDFRSVGDFVAAKMASSEYAHFLSTPAANATRPATTGNQAPAAQGTPVPPPEPRNLGDAIIQRHRDETAAKIAANPAPGSDLGRGFGGFGRGSGSTPSIATLSHILRGGR